MLVLLLLCLAALLVLAMDMRLNTVRYSLPSRKLRQSVRICLITDLHSCRYGKSQERLLEAIRAEEPDLVLLGGDIYDDKLAMDAADQLLSVLARELPCYYVSGNHEYYYPQPEVFFRRLEDFGVQLLLPGEAELRVNDQPLRICGVTDPLVRFRFPDAPDTQTQLAAFSGVSEDPRCTLLLAHRPELFADYAAAGFDFVFCGHAHGGQWRIPGLLNGLFAPNQGFFPRYAGGVYNQGGSTMVLSRGLARESTLLPRIFNRPELVIVDLTPEE